MTTITTPASLEEAKRQLGGLGELITAKKWERAAIVATFVRLAEREGRPSSGTATSGSLTPAEFAAFGINGLRSRMSVTKYVQAWLDTHDGTYPKAGRRVVLPAEEFPPMRTGTDGFATDSGAERTIDRLIEQHGPEVIAAAVRRPEVADAVVRDHAANVETIRASGRAHPSTGTRRSGNGFLDESAQALANVLFDWGVLQVEQGSKDLYDHLVTQRIREGEWLPGLKDQVATKVAEAIRRLQAVEIVLSAEVTDADLQDLLNS